MLLPWERLLWRGRGLPPGRSRYFLTDFRLARVGAADSDEILIEDVLDVRRVESRVERLLGRSTLLIRPRSGARAPFVLRGVRQGAQLAALLDLLAAEPHASIDAGTAAAMLEWEPRADHRGFREALFVPVAAFAFVLAVGVALHGRAAAPAYASDDAIYPNGEKRSHDDIVRFMETSVMPWAREALGPLKGGPERITCNTCHGREADSHDWQMPAVAALPQPDVAARGWETYSDAMDAQTRNAIYGYVAEAGKQTKAGYMREVVMPGMATLLRRPSYDFTKPYDYNRTHAAFGCYHCHQVK